MTTIGESVFRIALLAFPRSFRSAYGTEMIDVFRERVAERSSVTAISETMDAVAAGVSMRLASVAARRAIVGALAAAMFVTTFALQNARSTQASGRIDFTAEDPAGAFTLTVINGRPVGATVNKIPVAAQLIVVRSDSISILRPDGRAELTVAFNESTGQITWEPRQAQ